MQTLFARFPLRWEGATMVDSSPINMDRMSSPYSVVLQEGLGLQALGPKDKMRENCGAMTAPHISRYRDSWTGGPSFGWMRTQHSTVDKGSMPGPTTAFTISRVDNRVNKGRARPSLSFFNSRTQPVQGP